MITDAARDLAAQAWAELCGPLDRQLGPLGLRAMDALSPAHGETVMDLGCGAGQSSLQLAARVGFGGRVTGVDIAPRLLEVARRRARGLLNVAFVDADCSVVDLPTGSQDAAYSRFGVMAFMNPVGAFMNVRRMLKPNGRLAFVCWRALAENELDLLPLEAAGLEHLVDPTPFSFEASLRIREVLAEAGFRAVEIIAQDAAVTCGDLQTTLAVLLRVGALGKIVREKPDLHAAAEPRVCAALQARSDGGDVFLNSATWIVTARA